MASGSVFSETLQTITTTKLEELAKQRISYEEQYSTLLGVVQAEPDPLKRLFLLVDGTKSCLGVKTAIRKNKQDGKLGRVVSGGTSNKRLETDLKNLDRFLEQARYDPSVSPKVLQDWEKSLLQYLAVQSSKYQYADLYGKLVTEWLSSEKITSADGDIEMLETFEELPGAKKLEARREWEKSVFEPAKVDVPNLINYLQTLFTSKKAISTAIQNLHSKVEQFQNDLTGSSQFSVSTLRWVIQGLQASDLLSNDKREVLKDFLTNEIILTEVADVLNMRMSAIGRWSWGHHVPVEQRRKLNGTYSIHMHEDLLQAIFLHYIGVKWSVFFKASFLALRTEVWKSNQAEVATVDRKRRVYYLGPQGIYAPPNLQQKRSKAHQKQYFVSQLLDHESQRIEFQEGEEEATFDNFVGQGDFAGPSNKRRRQGEDRDRDVSGLQQQSVQQESVQRRMTMLQRQQQQQQMRMQQHMLSQQPIMAQQSMMAQQPMMAQNQMTNYNKDMRPGLDMDLDDEDVEPNEIYTGGADADSDSWDPNQAKKPMQAKQGLLHLLSTEIVINTRLHGEITCFRSVFESWNPLLPHESVLAVLAFFGVSEKWQVFFKTFLEAPLKFTDDDDDDSTTPRPRRRGTPGSHALSDVFGEVLLFCLDFSVNQSTDGALLYRMYDDFWFWSADYEKCATAWASVLQFTEAISVNLSEKKTGSVRVAHGGQEVHVDERLPEGEIRWGFLYLDPTDGTFEIDQKMVDSHVEELRKQLQSKSKSVIDWIQAWNSYAATFFSSNFGKAANCFGREHVDKMLATHRRIQESIFQGGNVVQYLKNTLKERFGVDDIPDGFLFFPVQLGGLDLKSPFVGLLQIREAVKENAHDLMDEFEEQEQQDYENLKRRFDSGGIQRLRYGNEDAKFKPSNPATFFPFEEYVRYREEFNRIGAANLIHVYTELLRRPKEESVSLSVQVSQALKQLQGQSNASGITASWGAMKPYWKWVAQMYGPEMVERFGGLRVVDPGLLPIGMVSMFRQKRTKWQG
ncbi:hypothetical protein K504DRAFT_461383 [Pleomassaria siparia CBS 279.74]|uniref:Reverse transcriptase domain-containing protein n=1 Tax=Pleomassaria siparia CBS 279.74 TaxID=1314801 RepID=A0A6G1JWC6_9PLEO|nr:hypothetical protein K504DRAFT_461383 [Pleomassaria siparia CBS 279.74]